MNSFGPIIAFILAAAAVEITPGPNMTYLALLSSTKGRKAGFSAVAGVSLGLTIIGIIAALGAATLIVEVPLAYQALRYGGVAYLLWLAYETWRGEEKTDPDANHSIRYFRDGLITNLLNPKAALFYVVVVPQFISGTDHALRDFLLLALIYVVVASIIHLSIVVASAQAQTFLSNGGRATLVRKLAAAALCLIAVWVLWSTRL